MKYLDKINGSHDLKKLSIDELKVLSTEIRDFIEDTVFKTGGHLSSNLGVVELSVALHYVFDFINKDKIVFDVSHQCYPHKILTGRKNIFHTLRQFGGMSGFTNPKESKADNFMFGHAGTSISTSLGIATAKRLKNNKGKSIALIGDASIGAGMSFEALNHAGHINEDMLVILNDNGMSIAESTGSFAKYLNKVRLNSCYQDIKEEIMSAVNKIPKLGKPMKDSIEHLLSRIKRHIGANGQSLFKELNFDYFGPIDGHDIPLLIHSLDIIKNFTKPILLHVITQKGKGHSKAMDDPEKYHGVSPAPIKVPSEKASDSGSKGKQAFTDIFSNSIIELAQKDERIVAITAAMPGGTGLNKFQKVFPDRLFDVGICEQHAVGFAAGQSLMGMKPVCAIYSTFTQRAYDQIFQEVCLNKNHVIFATDRAGIVGEDGATHTGAFDISFLRCLPNMVLMSPKDGLELKDMLKFSLTLDKAVSIRYPRDKSYPPSSSIYAGKVNNIELGKGEILKSGEDLILFGYGPMANSCLEAAYLLEKKGISTEVINPRFAKPIDKEIVSYALSKNKTIISVEDHSVRGGFGSILLEEINMLAKDRFKFHIHGIPDRFIEQGPRQDILKKLLLDPEGIANFAVDCLLKEGLVSTV